MKLIEVIYPSLAGGASHMGRVSLALNHELQTILHFLRQELQLRTPFYGTMRKLCSRVEQLRPTTLSQHADLR